MNKQEWIHIDPKQRQHKVGVMHDPKTGNLLVYFDKNVVLVDYKVFQTKKVKFFIDDELCELSVIRRKRGFEYQFNFDTKTKTPKNILRKKDIKQQTRKGLKWLVAVPLVIFLVAWIYISLRNRYLEHEMQTRSNTTWATYKVFKKTGSNVYQSFYYFDDGNNEGVQSKITYSKTTPLSPQGFPLKNKYKFKVKYATKHSFYHQIDFNSPSDETAQDLLEIVRLRHIQLHPQKTPLEIKCDIETAFQVKGLNGLADIYYQNTSPSENAKHHSDSYLRLIRDTPFVQAREKCFLK